MQSPPIAPVGGRQDYRCTGAALYANAVIVREHISRLQIGAGFELQLYTGFYAEVTAILNMYATVHQVRNIEFVPARRLLYGVILRNHIDKIAGVATEAGGGIQNVGVVGRNFHGDPFVAGHQQSAGAYLGVAAIELQSVCAAIAYGQMIKGHAEIGRASCRERVWMAVGAGALEGERR